MKLYYMKQEALDYFKNNMDILYTNYFTKDNNDWMFEKYGSEPFVEMRDDYPDFELADVDSYKAGELDLENCKIIYSNLRSLSPVQASDERFWAGLCNKVFYDYMKKRWKNDSLNNKKKDIDGIKNRFFFSGGIRSGLFSNTLARSWWIGKLVYDEEAENKFDKLKIIGAEDFSTKVFELFCKYSFSANAEILDGMIAAMDEFQKMGIKIITKETLRPALKYLNAYGGALLLDSLTSDEVKEIVLNKMIEIYNGEDSSFEFKDDEDEDIYSDYEEDADEEVYDNNVGKIAKTEISLTLEENDDENSYVDYGDTVLLKKVENDKETITFEIPMNKAELNGYNRKLLGLYLHDKVEINFDEYFVFAIKK